MKPPDTALIQGRSTGLQQWLVQTPADSDMQNVLDRCHFETADRKWYVQPSGFQAVLMCIYTTSLFGLKDLQLVILSL